jgi:hypothetical protein
MNDYYYKDVSDMYIDYNMSDIDFLKEKTIKDLLDMYLSYSHSS